MTAKKNERIRILEGLARRDRCRFHEKQKQIQRAKASSEHCSEIRPATIDEISMALEWLFKAIRTRGLHWDVARCENNTRWVVEVDSPWHEGWQGFGEKALDALLDAYRSREETK